jgi:hypothetical protein
MSPLPLYPSPLSRRGQDPQLRTEYLIDGTERAER